MSGKPRAIKHGTKGGYMAHRRRGEAPCGTCVTAWRLYYQEYNGSLPRRVFLRERAREKRVKTLRKAAKARECEVRKVKRAANRLSKMEEAQREQARVEDPSVGVEQLGGVPPQDISPVLGGLQAQAQRPSPPAEQG